MNTNLRTNYQTGYNNFKKLMYFSVQIVLNIVKRLKEMVETDGDTTYDCKGELRYEKHVFDKRYGLYSATSGKRAKEVYEQEVLEEVEMIEPVPAENPVYIQESPNGKDEP